jgi:hypothetical protein
MNGVHLNRASIKDGQFYVLESGYQFIQGILIFAIEHKTKTTFLLMLTKKDNGAKEVRVL